LHGILRAGLGRHLRAFRSDRAGGGTARRHRLRGERPGGDLRRRSETQSIGLLCSSDQEAFARRYDLVLASNALQYANDWRDMAARLASVSQRWLLILALPTVRTSPSFVVVQRPQGVGFAEDYISWVFNRAEFLAHIARRGFVLEREFLSIGELDASGAPEIAEHVGFLFKQPAATDAPRHAGAAHHRP
jgi:hypothetical protein